MRALLTVVIAASLTVGVAGAANSKAASPGAQWCAGTYDTSRHVAAPTLRFGVDPGVAGNPVPGGSVAPVRPAAETAALVQLRPSDRVLVVRLNRLFWSGGEALLQ